MSKIKVPKPTLTKAKASAFKMPAIKTTKVTMPKGIKTKVPKYK